MCVSIAAKGIEHAGYLQSDLLAKSGYECCCAVRGLFPSASKDDCGEKGGKKKRVRDNVSGWGKKQEVNTVLKGRGEGRLPASTAHLTTVFGFGIALTMG